MLADPAGDALLAELNHHPDMAAAVAAAAAERELGTAESVKQVIQWRLEKRRPAAGDDRNPPRPLPWLPTVPDTPEGDLRDWTIRRGQAIADRAAELAGIVAADRPGWAAPLGDRPAEPAPARDWDRAATLTAAYREQFAVIDETSILGPDQPDKGAQRRARDAAADAIRDSQRSNRSGPLDRAPSPDRQREHRDEPLAPRPYAHVGDRDLAERLAAAERTVTLTGGQLSGMPHRDADRSAAVVTASATVLPERLKRAVEHQLNQAQVLCRELNEEHQHRVSHPEASVPDEAREVGASRPASDTARSETDQYATDSELSFADRLARATTPNRARSAADRTPRIRSRTGCPGDEPGAGRTGAPPGGADGGGGGA
jgi:hypothetical protein